MVGAGGSPETVAGLTGVASGAGVASCAVAENAALSAAAGTCPKQSQRLVNLPTRSMDPR